MDGALVSIQHVYVFAFLPHFASWLPLSFIFISATLSLLLVIAFVFILVTLFTWPSSTVQKFISGIAFCEGPHASLLWLIICKMSFLYFSEQLK